MVQPASGALVVPVPAARVIADDKAAKSDAPAAGQPVSVSPDHQIPVNPAFSDRLAQHVQEPLSTGEKALLTTAVGAGAVVCYGSMPVTVTTGAVVGAAAGPVLTPSTMIEILREPEPLTQRLAKAAMAPVVVPVITGWIGAMTGALVSLAAGVKVMTVIAEPVLRKREEPTDDVEPLPTPEPLPEPSPEPFPDDVDPSRPGAGDVSQPEPEPLPPAPAPTPAEPEPPQTDIEPAPAPAPAAEAVVAS